MRERLDDDQRRRQVRFQEEDQDDSDRDQGVNPLRGREPNREERAPQQPAAIQRPPDRGGHVHHHHGPTVDQTVIQLLSYREREYPMDLDLTTVGFGVLCIAITYLSYYFRENIINDEVYDRFQESRVKYAEAAGINMVRLIAEAIKFFSLCAYDVMIIMYLVKPLKNSTNEERELVKQYQDLVKRINNADRANAQEIIKKAEQIQSKRSDMLSYRYTNYNSTMNLALKTGLTLNFIIAFMGLLSFFITSVI